MEQSLTVEPVESDRDRRYLDTLANVLRTAPMDEPWTTKEMAVELLVLRLRPYRRKPRQTEVQVLFSLDGLPGCTFVIGLGPGPAQTNEPADEWANLIRINLWAAFGSKRRLPKDCAAAADAEGLTRF